MTEWRLAFVTLLSHYRRHPWQLLFLLLGMVLGASLLVGVETINQEARVRYAASKAQASRGEGWQIQPHQREGFLDQSLWVQLRRSGIEATPVLDMRMVDAGDRPLLVRGVDPLAYVGQLGRPTGSTEARAWVDTRVAASHGWQQGDSLAFKGGQTLGPLQLIADLGPWIHTDIATLSELAQSGTRLSYLNLPALSEAQLDAIRRALPEQARLIAQGESTQFGQLSASFHLNLTALALMALAVSLFLAFNALRFSLTQRSELMAQLRSLGISQSALVKAVISELLLVGLVAIPISALAGSQFARAWMPQVQMTLSSLYGFNGLLSVQSLLLPLGLATLVILGAIVMVLGSLLLDPRVAISLGFRSRQQRQQTQSLGLMALGLMLLLLVAVGATQVTTTGMALALCGLLLVAGAALTPQWLQLCCRAMVRFRLKSALGEWALTDLDQQQRTTRVAMIAVMLALAAAVGMRMVVGSFELALEGYLKQRISADLYLRTGGDDDALWMSRLSALPGIDTVTPFRHQRARIGGQPGSIASLGDSAEHYLHLPIKVASDDWNRKLFDGGCLINERTQLMAELSLGQTIPIEDTGQPAFDCTLVGVYYDYGNLRAQAFISPQLMQARLGEVPLAGYSLEVGEGQRQQVYHSLLEWLSPAQLIQRERIRNLATTMFHQTFAVTTALNLLTLMVAAVGLFASLSSVEHHRLSQLATLLALGITRRQLLLAQLAQLGVIALFALILALPLGMALGHLLLDLVNRVAFGWTMPVHYLMEDWPALLGSLLLALLLAALWPLWRLSKAPVSQLMKGGE
ncbi:ABC transporter permease [Ferrimonas sediminicola]|uniref:ABC transporter permease n=1 Tax=Ferrimonas sediminicola TaxID=2569538 RepID=A0A4U1B9D2_9GAMM|nr:ABC transporter permease [Ferrimonas sediminicola]TKB47360.1 ABC transporter permease [Ferrimonas sediminicola]